MIDPTVLKSEWNNRRKVIFATLGFIALTIGYSVYAGGDDDVRVAAIWALSTVAMGVIGSYVFGAVQDDANQKKLAENMAKFLDQE